MMMALIALAASALLASSAWAVCERQIPHRLIFATATHVEVPSQVLLAKDKEQLKRILNRLEVGHPDRDFGRFDVRLDTAMRRFLVIIGRPRNNGCRETKFLCVQHGEDRDRRVQAAIVEFAPGCGCVCTDVAKGSAVFVVAVPSWVESADLLSLARVHHCEDCRDDCPLGADTINQDGHVEVLEACP